jgi:hypothetical protein
MKPAWWTKQTDRRRPQQLFATHRPKDRELFRPAKSAPLMRAQASAMRLLRAA